MLLLRKLTVTLIDPLPANVEHCRTALNFHLVYKNNYVKKKSGRKRINTKRIRHRYKIKIIYQRYINKNIILILSMSIKLYKLIRPNNK